jgi:hypothetical protein
MARVVHVEAAGGGRTDVPLTFSTDHRKRRTLATGKGIVTLADVVLYLAVCVRDQVYEFDHVIDLRKVTALTPDPEEVLRLAVAERRHLPPETVVFTALVATREHEMFALAEHLASAFGRDGVTVRVFGTKEEASQWLDRLRPARNRSMA